MSRPTTVAEPLLDVLNRLRRLILDDEVLVRVVASGRQKGEAPVWRRVEMRYVDLKAGRQLQVVSYDQTQAFTANHADPRKALDALLDQPFGNWFVETATQTHQVRVSKKRKAVVTTTSRTAEVAPERDHDRPKDRLLPEEDPVLKALGIADEHGRVKPSRQAKYRQVEEFLRALSVAIEEATKAGTLRTPTQTEPLQIVDLGCGNAYLTFVAQAYLSRIKQVPVHLIGVDVKTQSFDHNTALAKDLGVTDQMTFAIGGIGDVEVDVQPDIVLALHACDTATDDALARAVAWEAPLVLAAPCCHHDISAQLRRSSTPSNYELLTRDGILRERFADTLTDALRASVLQLVGYRVQVVEFVESQHTPRNTLIRAIRTGDAHKAAARQKYADLTSAWQIHPKLADLLAAELALQPSPTSPTS